MLVLGSIAVLCHLLYLPTLRLMTHTVSMIEDQPSHTLACVTFSGIQLKKILGIQLKFQVRLGEIERVTYSGRAKGRSPQRGRV
jgi:hypothetical protein